MFKYGYVLMLLIIICLPAVQASAQGEPTYLGEICYSMMCDGCIAAPPMVSRLGMLLYGPDHLLLTGAGGTHGAASVDGTNIIVLLSSAFVISDQNQFSQIHMVVNPTTLWGTYTEMLVGIIPPPVQIFSTKGFVEFFPCGPGI